MLAGVITLVLVSVIVSGVGGLGTAVVAAPFAALPAVVIRMRVHATPEGLVVNRGFRRSLLSWDRIQGIRIEDANGERRVHVLVDGDRTIPLPVANGGALLTSRRELTEVRDALVAAQSRFGT